MPHSDCDHQALSVIFGFGPGLSLDITVIYFILKAWTK